MGEDTPGADGVKLSPDVLVTIIGEAIQDRDFKSVDAALRLLAVSDPRRAADVYDTLRVGLLLAKGE